MEFNKLPDFELDLELDETAQENEQGQEKTTQETPINTEVEDIEEETEIQDEIKTDEKTQETEKTYNENADDLAIQTYNHLVERGVVLEDPENPFDGTWEKLEESLESLPQRVLNTIIEESPDIAKQVVKFAFSSENITVDDFKQFAKQYLEELENSTDDEIETMDEARELLENVYKERGMRPSAIRAALDALEEDDALLDEARIEKEKVAATRHKNTDALIVQKQQEDAQRIDAQRAYVAQISNELDNVGWSKQRIDRIKQIMTNNQLGDLLNKTINSPKAIIKLIDFVDHYDAKTNDIDYSKFIAKAETKQAKGFRDKVEQAISTPNSNTKTTLTNPNSELDDLDPIVQF